MKQAGLYKAESFNGESSYRGSYCEMHRQKKTIKRAATNGSIACQDDRTEHITVAMKPRNGVRGSLARVGVKIVSRMDCCVLKTDNDILTHLQLLEVVERCEHSSISKGYAVVSGGCPSTCVRPSYANPV